MTIHKSRMQRHVRDRKQERKFLYILIGVTLLLMLVLYGIYG